MRHGFRTRSGMAKTSRKGPSRKPRAEKKAPPGKRSAAKTAARSDADETPHGKASRSIWTGSISFGLVQIPVRLLGAERSQELTFHQLDRRDQARIRYERINEQTGDKVAWDDIVKGFELDDGSVVVMEDKDFENAAPETTHTIDISDFVDGREISPSFFERPYFVVPDRGGDKPYALIRDVLEKTGLMAVGLVVIRTRQHLCAILPQGKGLVLELLRFADELLPLKSVSGDFPGDVKASAKEVALAEQLVESLRGKWEPAKYKDVYRSELLSAIEHKAKTGKLPAQRKAPAKSNITDLVSLLQKSVARSGKHRAA